MHNSYNFSTFSRQSSKGIIVHYFLIFFKSLKSSWVLIPILLTKKSAEISTSKIIIAIVCILIYLLIRSILWYVNFKFKIKEHNFILKQGILKKSTISIPFSKIQHVNFKQNFIQQLINVTEVEIETAGAKKVEVAIKALTREQAQALKDALFVNQLPENEITDVVHSKNNNVNLLKVGPFELLKVSISENHLHSFLLLFAFIFSGFVQVKDFLKDLGIDHNLDEVVEKNANTLVQDTLLVVVLILFSFGISVFISFLRTFLNHFNLKVSIKENAIEIEQGLINKKLHNIKKEKVQYIVVSTNPLKKWMGINNVLFKQATSGRVKLNRVIKIVGVNTNQIKVLKNKLFTLQTLNIDDKIIPHSYYLTQLYFKYFMGLIALNFIALLNYNLLFANFIAIPLIIVLVQLKYQKSYFKLSNELLEVGHGQISSSILYMELFKVQHITIKQTVFQKRRQVVNLIMQTASGKIVLPCVTKNMANQLYNYILYKVEISDKSWM